MTERKLVSVRLITEIRPIDGADSIECAVIDGWTVVVKRDEFHAGDYCVFFEIDSFLPAKDPRYEFLLKNKITWEGKEGIRLRTIKLRGQLSQGLALPLDEFPELANRIIASIDLAAVLGVEKWEVSIPGCLAGEIHGYTPRFFQKPDQQRAQNLLNEIFVDNKDSQYEVSIKLDGTSCTVFYNNGTLGVCSRNLWLKLNEKNENNSFVRVANSSGLLIALERLGRNLAVQGELMGPGIQGNREKLEVFELFVFDIFDIDAQCYLSSEARLAVFAQLKALGVTNLNHVPIMTPKASLESLLPVVELSALLSFAEGPSLNNQVREGLVFKRHDGKFSFKVISNKFLLKDR